MSQGISFNIYVMSYRRAHEIMTKDLVEYCTYVVREEEAQEYRDAGIEDLLIIPNGATTSTGCRIFNWVTTFFWIIENTPEDVVCILDDDIQSFIYRTIDRVNIRKDKQNHQEVATSEIERIAQLLVDLNLGFACDMPNKALYAYSGEFEFKCTPAGVRWVNKAAFKAVCRPEDDAASDVDIVMQELLKNRIILNPRYFCGDNIMYTNKGGSDHITSEANEQYKLAMKNKWGRYFDFDNKKNIVKINVKR